MIWYFWNNFKLSIEAQLDNYNQDLNVWNKIIKKTINIKTKVSRNFLSATWEIDAEYFEWPRPNKNDESIKKSNNFDGAKSSHSFFSNFRDQLGQLLGQILAEFSTK